MIKLWCFSMYHLIFKLTLFMQLKLYSSLVDNHFGDCIPMKCGDLTVSYPFYIIHQQRAYCGYPGFEIYCEDNFPYINISSAVSQKKINISGVSYVVKNVSYEDQTVQVTNSMLLESFKDKKVCFETLEHLNLTLNNDVFEHTTKHSDMFLVLNCPPKILQEISQNMVFCGALGVYQNESRLEDLKGKCNGVVTVPYEGVKWKDGNVKEMLEEGFSLKWIANNCSACVESGGQCGFQQDISQFSCFCPDRAHAYHCAPLTMPAKKVHLTGHFSLLLALGASTMGIVTLIAFVICFKRRTIVKVSVLWSERAKGNKNVEAFLKIYGSLAPTRFTYSDIRLMTNSFKHKLGEGGYGTVYKGKLQDGRFVAVKKLKNLKGNGEEFINEVVSISRTNHINVVALLGFCSHGKNRALVYEFMSNGSLEKYTCRTGNELPLPQETMVNIAIGVAKGLDYLHSGCNARILHFDIKPHNILLDQEFCPKISDFGLAKLSETNSSMTSMMEARGTIGYIAPEVFCRNFGGVSHKSDVYSYGMMVLDMACERKNLVTEARNISEQYFPDWIYDQLEVEEEVGIHDGITDHGQRGSMRKMILVGLWCIQTYPSNRPSMSRAVEMLEGEVESIEMPPKPLLCSPPRSGIRSSGRIVSVL